MWIKKSSKQDCMCEIGNFAQHMDTVDNHTMQCHSSGIDGVDSCVVMCNLDLATQNGTVQKVVRCHIT